MQKFTLLIWFVKTGYRETKFFGLSCFNDHPFDLSNMSSIHRGAKQKLSLLFVGKFPWLYKLNSVVTKVLKLSRFNEFDISNMSSIQYGSKDVIS